MSDSGEARYPLAPWVPARALGRLAVVMAGLVILAVVLTAVGWRSTWVVIVVLVPVGVVLALLLLAALALIRPPAILRLDGVGYEVRWLRRCGVRGAPWARVREVRSESRRFGPMLVIRLGTPDETTVIPLSLLQRAQTSVEDDVRERLDAASGRRPG